MADHIIKKVWASTKCVVFFPVWTKADSPEDYFNSDVVKNVRETMLRGEWHPGWKSGKEQTEAGLNSDRESFIHNLDIKINPC